MARVTSTPLFGRGMGTCSPSMNPIRLDRSRMRNTIPAYRRRRSLGERSFTTTTRMASRPLPCDPLSSVGC